MWSFLGPSAPPLACCGERCRDVDHLHLKHVKWVRPRTRCFFDRRKGGKDGWTCHSVTLLSSRDILWQEREGGLSLASGGHPVRGGGHFWTKWPPCVCGGVTLRSDGYPMEGGVTLGSGAILASRFWLGVSWHHVAGGVLGRMGFLFFCHLLLYNKSPGT